MRQRILVNSGEFRISGVQNESFHVIVTVMATQSALWRQPTLISASSHRSPYSMLRCPASQTPSRISGSLVTP